MVDINKLEKKIKSIDEKYNLSKIDEDTFAAIVVLTEKKDQFKKLMRGYTIGRRYNRITSIIKSEFPNCNINELTWFLFKNGYIEDSKLSIMLVAFSVSLYLIIMITLAFIVGKIAIIIALAVVFFFIPMTISYGETHDIW